MQVIDKLIVTLENTQNDINAMIAGAEVLGAGRTLGLTDDEAIALRNQTRRRDQRKKRDERASREGNRSEAEKYLRQDEREFQSKGGYASEIDDAAWAFGEDPEYMGGEVRAQDIEQSYSREEKVRNDVLPDEFYTDSEVAEQSEGRNRAKPTEGIVRGAMTDALERLREGKDRFGPGYEGFGADAAAMQSVDDRLSGQLDGDIQQQRDKRQAAQAATEDRRVRRGDLSDKEIRQQIAKRVRTARPEGGLRGGALFDRDVEIALDAEQELLNRRERGRAGVPEMIAMQVQARAAKEADDYRNKYGGLPRQLADADIGRINEIRSLGGAMPFASHDAVGNFQVVQSVNPQEFREAVPLVDRDGNIREYYGYEDQNLVQLGEVNMDSTDQELNAPKPTAGQSFVSDNIPDFGREGGTTFGYPQVGINEEMQLLGDRIRGLSGYGYEGVGNPRSMIEFDKAINAIIERGQDKGDTFWRYDPETRKQMAIEEPTVDDVLYKLGYTDQDKSRLANALFQGAAALNVDINQEDKQAFAGRQSRPFQTREDLSMNVGEMRPDGGLALDRIVNEKVGRGKKASSVRAGLAAINDEPVTEALRKQGALTTTTPDGKEVMLPEAERMIAGARQSREEAQKPLYGSLTNDSVERARFMRGKDRGKSERALAQQYGPARASQAAEVERRYLEDRKFREKSVMQKVDPIAESQRMMDNEIARLGADNRSRDTKAELQRLAGPNPVNTTRTQPTQQAPVAPSIALETGAPTGNQGSPQLDAGGSQPIPAGMKRELDNLTPPYKALGYMSEPDSVNTGARDRREIVKRIERDNLRRRGGAGLISAGALATVLGLTSDNDKEERN